MITRVRVRVHVRLGPFDFGSGFSPAHFPENRAQQDEEKTRNETDRNLSKKFKNGKNKFAIHIKSRNLSKTEIYMRRTVSY